MGIPDGSRASQDKPLDPDMLDVTALEAIRGLDAIEMRFEVDPRFLLAANEWRARDVSSVTNTFTPGAPGPGRTTK